MIISLGDKIPRIAESSFISESACIIGDVEIGEKCIVFPGAVIRGDFGGIKIGNNVWIEDNSVLHGAPPCMEIGDSVLIAHGAVVNCRKIASKVLIGINATVLHETEIEERCVIAAGAVVSERMKIPSGSFLAGVPAKILGEATKKQLEWVERDPELLASIVRMYKEPGKGGIAESLLPLRWSGKK